ncbi:hypothetical protein PDIG_66380 [Penicillium digitatum PHI26]|uniref:Uncharacterized protein n=2 Tax=Penicillium digitatum TaxID=36651 RepID=K9FHR9_PEND2|nr:hypothetical protein PDIP_75680 [Penicillium digitatum Pd1]EKV06866.1 hypothetical protein PDIP_75680 [Penicillium digitatum Pd1]EKV08774.1 hypothetical protein PDIG_66380 [Penicillium digitatum PHI26]
MVRVTFEVVGFLVSQTNLKLRLAWIDTRSAERELSAQSMDSGPKRAYLPGLEWMWFGKARDGCGNKDIPGITQNDVLASGKYRLKDIRTRLQLHLSTTIPRQS